MTTGLRPWLPAVAWATLIFVLSSIPGKHYPPSPFWSADKLVHMVVYGVLGALGARALRARPHGRSLAAILMAGSLATLYGMTDELHQLFVPGRHGEWNDVIADAAGGFMGAALFAAVRRQRAVS